MTYCNWLMRFCMQNNFRLTKSGIEWDRHYFCDLFFFSFLKNHSTSTSNNLSEAFNHHYLQTVCFWFCTCLKFATVMITGSYQNGERIPASHLEELVTSLAITSEFERVRAIACGYERKRVFLGSTPFTMLNKG